jgi:hypothetical protein
MVLILLLNLTFLLVSTIIVIAVKKRNKYFAKIVTTQSSLHQIVKHFIPKDLFDLPKRNSQAKKHLSENNVKVMIVEDQAYWVHNNMFYKAETINGFVDPESVQPIDTNNMSKRDIDKMLFILDNLKNGNSDDSSSTWNS